MKQDFPMARAGMRIGLLGGSFDPPHDGHVHLTREALKRFGLDRVWWLVSPGNPLKRAGPAAIGLRLEAAGKLMKHPRVEVTALETVLGTRYTAQTLRRLRALYPGVHFVWLMGADNLAGFHQWDRWQSILENVAVGVVARPGSGLAARRSMAATRFARARLPASAAQCLGRADPPAWCFVNIPLRATSSTDLRALGNWPQAETLRA